MDAEKRNLLIHTAETLIKTHDADLRETLVELALRVERETLEEAASKCEEMAALHLNRQDDGIYCHSSDAYWLRRMAGEVK